MREEIIRRLITEPYTAEELARALRVYRDEVLETLLEMKIAGQVAPRFPDAEGDMYCENCGAEYEDEDWNEECETCETPSLRDTCRWIYCGGPVSQALSATAEAAVGSSS